MSDAHDALRSLDVRVLGKRLGLEQGRGLGPCPCCGATQRGKADRRPPIHCSASRWTCEPCGATGGSTGLVAARVLGTSEPDNWAAVFAWAEQEGLAPSTGARKVAYKPLPKLPPSRRERQRLAASERVQTLVEMARGRMLETGCATSEAMVWARATWCAMETGRGVVELVDTFRGMVWPDLPASAYLKEDWTDLEGA